ncbi:putative dynein light chain roadblock-type 2 [Paratrimastix pyriformis]|uniref:Dynein light chain roadblock n=1 Tax=Paratrimastix pyriformis TaxID=342808 RepID=A0ABQ8URF1_9EUKA|nr:putative dynein light chain roadblock-type 2 [Paratrimastix pyriformis]
MSEVEDTLKRISSHKGVTGLIVLNQAGIPIRTTMEPAVTIQCAALFTRLCSKARSTIKKLDEADDLSFLRLRTKKHEILVAPDREYLLVVFQNPQF